MEEHTIQALILRTEETQQLKATAVIRTEDQAVPLQTELTTIAVTTHPEVIQHQVHHPPVPTTAAVAVEV